MCVCVCVCVWAVTVEKFSFWSQINLEDQKFDRTAPHSIFSSVHNNRTQTKMNFLQIKGRRQQIFSFSSWLAALTAAELGQQRLTVNGHVASALCCWVDCWNNEPHRPVWFPLETAEREFDPHAARLPLTQSASPHSLSQPPNERRLCVGLF